MVSTITHEPEQTVVTVTPDAEHAIDALTKCGDALEDIERRRTFAMIPTLGESEHLEGMLDSLLEDPSLDEVWLYLNDIERQWPVHFFERGRRLVLVDADRWPIHRMWNHAIERARCAPQGAELAILNDDLTLSENMVWRVVGAMRGDPDVWIASPDYRAGALDTKGATLRDVHGVWWRGGIAGFAFVVRADRVPNVDEQFEWWGGDQDLVLSIERAGGRAAIVQGVSVVHHSSTTANRHEWTQHAAARDRERIVAKWGESEGW